MAMEAAAVTVCAPFAGTVEWAVAEGAQLEALQVMGWLSVQDHCALRPLIAPTAGQLTWRRSDELAAVQAGTPLAQLGEDEEALQQCQCSERVDALRLEGEVVAITKVPGMGKMGVNGVRATLKTADGVLDVHLRPDWFVENQELKLAAKDKISVTGSKVTMQGKPSVIATEITRGDESLKLREPDGLPVWVAARRRM